MKTTLRKLLSLILSFAVTAGILCVAQGTVLAHGSEGEKDFCYLAMDCDGATPAGFPEDGYIYFYSPWGDGEICQSWDGASYDVVTNTLTLNNFNHPNVGLIIDGMDEGNCGSEFKIVLIGDNHIQRIDDGFSGMYIQGSGTVTINENQKSQGGTVFYNKGWDPDRGIPQFHIGKDATVTIYKSPDMVTESGDVYPSYCISISGVDQETETVEDYLVYDGKVTPEIEWEFEESSPAYDEYVYLTDLVYVKTNFDTSRLFAEKDNPDVLRLLVDGKVEDSNETYAWLEKHNGKWYVSRSSWYDDDISGAYTGTIPSDLKTGDNQITAYMVAASPLQSEIYMDANYLYTKDDKYYAILPECMLVDEWSVTDASSEVFCIGEVIHDTPSFEFASGEPYDPYIMDSFKVVSGVSTGSAAAQYMEQNGYKKVIANSYNATYVMVTKNSSITFSPDKADTPVSKWVQENNNWYYYDANGNKVTGWQQIGGKWYYFESSGIMVTGWRSSGGKWYYFENSGEMVTGWKSVGGKWYYFNGGGDMATGWVSSGGKWYYFDGSGIMATGWKSIGGKWYYFNGGGDMLTGWLSSGGKWYYFNGGGDMATGWLSSGGKWYYFDGSGAMATGWKQVGSTWYYFNGGGDMVTGWKQIGGKWYYFYGSGAMASNTTIDGCKLDSSGAWVT
ncbi:MAG: hypothetical protein K5665_11565 [Saccharofermentans sp.]|nr:hypothetical protein [Saccharofermentans sp.]